MKRFNYSLISDIEIDGLDTRDYPDFCDAYISFAMYDGREMTEDELYILNEDTAFVYDMIWLQVH